MFPKDTEALINYAQSKNIKLSLLEKAVSKKQEDEMIATIEPIVETVLEALESDMDRYEYLIELGDSLASIGVEEMISDNNYVAGYKVMFGLHTC